MIRRKRERIPGVESNATAGLSSSPSLARRGQRSPIPMAMYGKSAADGTQPPDVTSKPIGAFGKPSYGPAYGPATGGMPVADPVTAPSPQTDVGGFPAAQATGTRQTTRWPTEQGQEQAPGSSQNVGNFGWAQPPAARAPATGQPATAAAPAGMPGKPRVPGGNSGGGGYRPFPGLGGIPRLR